MEATYNGIPLDPPAYRISDDGFVKLGESSSSATDERHVPRGTADADPKPPARHAGAAGSQTDARRNHPAGSKLGEPDDSEKQEQFLLGEIDRAKQNLRIARNNHESAKRNADSTYAEVKKHQDILVARFGRYLSHVKSNEWKLKVGL